LDQLVEVDEVQMSGSLMLSLLALQMPFHLQVQFECNWEQYLLEQHVKAGGDLAWN
jgi:hypothetical protein